MFTYKEIDTKNFSYPVPNHITFELENKFVYNCDLRRCDTRLESIAQLVKIIKIARTDICTGVGSQNIHAFIIRMFIMNMHWYTSKSDLQLGVTIVEKLRKFLAGSNILSECSELFTKYLRCITEGHCRRSGDYELCLNPVSKNRLLCDECTTYSLIPSNPLEISKIISDYCAYYV
jgi:hypothetical protein